MKRLFFKLMAITLSAVLAADSAATAASAGSSRACHLSAQILFTEQAIVPDYLFRLRNYFPQFGAEKITQLVRAGVYSEYMTAEQDAWDVLITGTEEEAEHRFERLAQRFGALAFPVKTGRFSRRVKQDQLRGEAIERLFDEIVEAVRDRAVQHLIAPEITARLVESAEHLIQNLYRHADYGYLIAQFLGTKETRGLPVLTTLDKGRGVRAADLQTSEAKKAIGSGNGIPLILQRGNLHIEAKPKGNRISFVPFFQSGPRICRQSP